jgi:hypothetical protein
MLHKVSLHLKSHDLVLFLPHGATFVKRNLRIRGMHTGQSQQIEKALCNGSHVQICEESIFDSFCTGTALSHSLWMKGEESIWWVCDLSRRLSYLTLPYLELWTCTSSLARHGKHLEFHSVVNVGCWLKHNCLC